MAQDFQTLADLVTLNTAGISEIEVSDVLNDSPVLRLLAADTASNGTSHKYLKEVAAPVVGFRAVNKGRELDHSEDELVTIDLEILDASFDVDMEWANSYQKGGALAYLSREGRRALRAAFFAAECQFFRGKVAGDAGGFVGLPDAAALNQLADAMVIGAGGTAALTSVWAIRTLGTADEVTVIMGQNGEISIGESTVIQKHEVDEAGALSTKVYPAFYTPITGWIGLQIGSAYSVGRLANIDAGDHMLDDDQLSALLELFPESRPPTHFIMNKRSRGQLQRSRTVYSPTGAPAPVPVEYMGIPIITTGAIASNETQIV